MRREKTPIPDDQSYGHNSITLMLFQEILSIISPGQISMLFAAIVGLAMGHAVLEIHGDEILHESSPNLFGVFFEEINHAGDGGIYGELVENTKLEGENVPTNWELLGNPIIDRSRESSFLRILGKKGEGLSNDGFWGISVQKDHKYTFKILTRGHGTLNASLVSPQRKILASSIVKASDRLSMISVTLQPNSSSATARLDLKFVDSGQLDIGFVSLFDQSLSNQNYPGFRQDLFDLLNSLKPAFLRFPGGCWVEGDQCATSYRWKTTIGSKQDRITLPNLWNYTSSHGLGYHEYLELCEKLGATALFVINCGMAHKDFIPLPSMDEYVQDALDAIEYATGSPNTRWGAIRAKNGHPKPFDLKFIEVGNENGGPLYSERYPLFYRAIKKRYPKMHIIANDWGGIPKSAPVDIVDEHYYNSPQFFIDNFNRYDKESREGPKVYVGEYAVTQGCGNGNLIAALAEGVFMQGMERNSDHVIMASYAPLFANIHNKAWNPDMICFDSSRSYGTPSYYVQRLFSHNRIKAVLNQNSDFPVVPAPKFPAGGVGIGTWGTQAEFRNIVVLNQKLEPLSPQPKLTFERGQWSEKAQSFQQNGADEPAIAWTSNLKSENYSIRCQARKLGGREGFLIVIGKTDDNNYIWWNIGGWGNTLDTIEQSEMGSKRRISDTKNFSVENGHWYNIEIRYSRDKIECFLDSKLVHTASLGVRKTLFASSGIAADGSTVVKVTNVGSIPILIDIKLARDVQRVKTVDIDVLSKNDPLAENSLESPKNVYPQHFRSRLANGMITRELPAYSLTILKIKKS